jgi:DDE superfamily endonuclease
MDASAAWAAFVQCCAPVFNRPSMAIFGDLVTGWVLAPSRRTITRMITIADPLGCRAHDAYHRFVRDGAWTMASLWRLLAVHVIARFAVDGTITLDCDDTLFHKTGRRINGAGRFRDPSRSTVARVVYATGLNLVVVTVRVTPPWGGCPIGIPVNMRLRPKGDPTPTTEHAAAMIRELATWLPERSFHLCCDGAYASIAGANLPRCEVTSRMRRDAALYQPAPPRTGRRGRPRTKGDRLPTPPQLADQARRRAWRRIIINMRGRPVERLVLTHDVLWHVVNKSDLVRLVIVRDPTGIDPDEYFVTTDLTATGADTASRYAGRWSIEITFRDTKQHLGGQDPQSWKRQGPQRAAALSLWLHGAVWSWYLDTHPDGNTWPTRPWYHHKTTPSFLDALAALRRTLWSQRITATTFPTTDNPKFTATLLDTLAYAA